MDIHMDMGERDTTFHKRASFSSKEPHIAAYPYGNPYEVATISRLLKNMGLFCRISSLS